MTKKEQIALMKESMDRHYELSRLFFESLNMQLKPLEDYANRFMIDHLNEWL